MNNVATVSYGNWKWPFFTFLFFVVLIFIARTAFGEPGIIDAGADRSAELTSVANIVKTLQVIAFKWIAPAIGGCLCIYGIFKIAVRETLIGTISLICGGAMFFVQKIIESLTKLAG